MFCPNCGSKNSTEQSFCRSCGLNLERISESILEQLEKSDRIAPSKISKFFETLGKLGFGGLIGAGLAGIFFIIVTIFNKFILTGQIDKIIIGIVFIIFIISAVLGLAYVIYLESEKEKKKKISAIRDNEIEAKDTNKLLEEKPFEPIMSVTERTTDLIFTEAKTSGELR